MESNNILCISDAIKDWMRGEGTQGQLSEPKDDSGGSEGKIEEHPHPHHTEITYHKAIRKFLEMLETKYHITPDEPLTRLSMEHFIAFPAWISAWKSKDVKDETGKIKRKGKPLEKSSRKLYGNGVESFRKWLSINGYIQASSNDRDRLDDARKKYFRLPTRLPNTADDGAVQACLDAALSMKWDSKIKKRNIAILNLMVDSGLRIHEICKLKIGDLNLAKKIGRIIGKGDKEAQFRYNAADVERLRDYWQERGWENDPNDPVFAAHDKSAGKKNEKHRHLTTSAVYQMVQDVADWANVTVWPHAFRHEFVLRTYRATKDIVLSQKLARHSNIKTTKDYVDLDNEETDRGYRDVWEGDAGKE